jgi:hypothetical protein
VVGIKPLCPTFSFPALSYFLLCPPFLFFHLVLLVRRHKGSSTCNV